MNLRYLFMAASIVFVTAASAQDKEDEKPALITLTAGWSNANLVQGDAETDQRNGFFLGVRKDIRIVPFVHLETGLLYVQKGASFTNSGSNQEYRLNYLDIPLAVKPKIGPVYGILGLSGNFKVYSKIDDQTVDDIAAFDLTTQAGIGYKFLMLSLDFRWNRGLLDIAPDIAGDPIHNSYFLIGLGFSFHKE